MNFLPKKLMLLGSGELGKEVTIAGKRIGCEIIACDRYKKAPAMQIADHSEVFDMNDHDTLIKIVNKYKPDLIIPEIEALAVEALEILEKEGNKVIPNASATKITMNRDQIRNLAANELGLRTAKFAYASNQEELVKLAPNLGWPVFIKPVMSSSGKGQSLVNNEKDLGKAWDLAMKQARGKSNMVIIEEFINFELEITLLTIKQKNKPTLFCEPIGHKQVNGDYQSSWQPASLSKEQLKNAQKMAKIVTDKLGGCGIFGVEFFITDKEVIFSELSPRPHDTGMVTLISQNLNEFDLHIRAILDLPIPKIVNLKPSASAVILAQKDLSDPKYSGIDNALKEENTNIFIFGKPNCKKGRRMGVALAQADDVQKAIKKAKVAASCINLIDAK